jgi:peptide/nickel transport system substrate-binding protein
VPRPAPIVALAASLMLVAVLPGCGSSGAPAKPAAAGTSTPPLGAHRGGTLTVLMADDIDTLDPGQAYYSVGYMLQYAVNRTLYGFEPHDVVTPHADLASGPPAVSADGKTITIHIRPGIRYAPPLHQTVVAADFKYAIERAFSAHVASSYAGLYFGVLVGAPTTPPDDVPDIPGIQTPDPQTVVLKLTKPYAPTVLGGLTLPISVPVPQAYAAPFDKHNPTTYSQHLAFTGPYMVVHDATGKITGYKPGRSIVAVRNPNWNPKTDHRPAYVNQIMFAEGNSDQDVASRRVLNGSKLVNGDFGPTPAVIQQALATKPSQISITPNPTYRAVSMNTTLEPFTNLNVRKAVIAAFDRNALLLSRGGTVQGTAAWAYIPPGTPGFRESGGFHPPARFDYMAHFGGDLALAQSYMRKAGYPSGRYTGSAHPLLVGISGGVTQKAAEITQAQLARLGIHVKLRLTTGDAYMSEFCGVPAAKVAVCTSTSWGRDFPDAQTVLQPTFDCASITPSDNANTSQLNDPAINRVIAAATAVPAGPARAAAWATVNTLVVGQAPAVIYQWDKLPNIESRDVAGVVNLSTGSYDLSYTSVR